jgi:putative transposase
VRRSFKYRLFTNANQRRELSIMLESHRRLYNSCLEQRKAAYEAEQRSVKYAEQSARFKSDRVVNTYYARLNFSSAQATMRRLDKAYANFFRRVKEGTGKPGFPRFKGRDRYDSIEFPTYRDGIRLTGNKLYVQHVGTIRVKLHRPVRGVIKTATLKREADKWFVVFSCELPDVAVVESDKPATGIDVGLTHFLTKADGKREPNPRYLKTALPALRVAGRAVARKKKGGTNRRKAVRCLRKIHVRVKNLRREHHYAVACRLVLAFGFIAVERLNIQGMLKTGWFNRAISDVGWANFLSILKSKCESAGVGRVEVDPRGTSQTCVCGATVKKDLTVRWHDCSECGLSQDRDHVSARVILARGLAARTGPMQANVGQQAKRPARSRRVHATE